MTSAVLDPLSWISSTAARAKPAHSHRRRGFSAAAAASRPKPLAMWPPSAFFSFHSPRQAPGNRVVIRPQLGTRTAIRKQPTMMTAKAVAITSASSGQSNRAARATPASVVRSSAGTRRPVSAGSTDHSTDAEATAISPHSSGEAASARTESRPPCASSTRAAR